MGEVGLIGSELSSDSRFPGSHFSFGSSYFGEKKRETNGPSQSTLACSIFVSFEPDLVPLGITLLFLKTCFVALGDPSTRPLFRSMLRWVRYYIAVCSDILSVIPSSPELLALSGVNVFLCQLHPS